MLFEEVVEKIKRSRDPSVRVGVLVEYPLGRHRQEVHGTFLRKSGRKYTAPHSVQKASVVILLKKAKKRGTIDAVKICCRKRLVGRSDKKTITKCNFISQKKQIRLCELSDSGKWIKTETSDFYVLDLSGKKPNRHNLKMCAKGIQKKLKEEKIQVKKLEFFANCNDINWLDILRPNNLCKSLQKLLKPIQRSQKISNIETIKRDIEICNMKLNSLENDLFEAKDTLKPKFRRIKIILGKPIIWQLITLGIGIYALFISLSIYIFQATVFNDLTNSSNSNALVLAGVIFIVIVSSETRSRYKKKSKLEKFYNKYKYIEESRERQTEEYYKNS